MTVVCLMHEIQHNLTQFHLIHTKIDYEMFTTRQNNKNSLKSSCCSHNNNYFFMLV